MATDAFAQGKLAFQHNHPMSSCDYPVGSSLRAEWMAGWTEAANSQPGLARQPGGGPATPTGQESTGQERAAHRL